MERRRIIQLLAGTAASLWAQPYLSSMQVFQPLIPLFPLDLVLLPHTVLPLHIFEPRYKEMVQDCLDNSWEFGMLSVQDQTLNRIGCTASITEVLERFPDGRLNILVRGRRVFEISGLNEDKSYYRGVPRFLDDDMDQAPPSDVLQQAIELYSRLMALAKSNAPFQGTPPVSTDAELSYRMMAGVPAELPWMQNLLELRSERERLDLVMRYFEKLIDEFEQAPDRPGAPARGVA